MDRRHRAQVWFAHRAVVAPSFFAVMAELVLAIQVYFVPFAQRWGYTGYWAGHGDLRLAAKAAHASGLRINAVRLWPAFAVSNAFALCSV